MWGAVAVGMNSFSFPSPPMKKSSEGLINENEVKKNCSVVESQGRFDNIIHF